MRSNDDTLSLMIEHEVDDVDYGVIIKRGDKTIHRFGYKYPEDDDLVPNEPAFIKRAAGQRYPGGAQTDPCQPDPAASGAAQ